MLEGFRFVRRRNVITWIHRSEMIDGDIDCTELDDDALQREVCRALGIFKFCPPQQCQVEAR